MTAVSNTGPLLVLAKLHHLHLLPALFTDVLIPAAVYHEAVTVGSQRGYPDAAVLAAFLNVHRWLPHPTVTLSITIRQAPLGPGEAQAIALAQQTGAELLIDDATARLFAASLDIATVGALGILVRAYRHQLLTADALDELLGAIEQRNDIWIRPELCQRVRRSVLARW